jgi:hypothetical protein
MSVNAIIGKRDGHVGLAAPEIDVELAGLGETLVARRGKPEHHFSECYNFRHIVNIMKRVNTKLLKMKLIFSIFDIT